MVFSFLRLQRQNGTRRAQIRSFPHLRPCISRQPRGTNKRQSECWRNNAKTTSGGPSKQETVKRSAERKETRQMPKARRDRFPYERHNRIVHLLKTECSFPAASQTACMPPHSRFLFTPAKSAACFTDMPATPCRKLICAITSSKPTPYTALIYLRFTIKPQK